MTRDDLLRMLFAAADDVDRSFDRTAAAAWPRGSLDALQRLGILRRSAGGMYATCPNCDEGHVEAVTAVDGRFYLSCPQAMVVEVEPELCERWEIDPAGLAAAVGRLLGLKGRPQQVIKGLAAGECLYLGASGSKRGISWEITFSFAAQPNAANLQVGEITVAAEAGWEYLWVLYENVADQAADMIVRRPRAAYVEEVYESADFAGLGIGV